MSRYLICIVFAYTLFYELHTAAEAEVPNASHEAQVNSQGKSLSVGFNFLIEKLYKKVNTCFNFLCKYSAITIANVQWLSSTPHD